MEPYTMSKRKLDRLELIRRHQIYEIGIVAAAQLIGLSPSQVHRLTLQLGIGELVSSSKPLFAIYVIQNNLMQGAPDRIGMEAPMRPDCGV